MDHPLGQHPGTTWHKCDFQCHTPRDRSWSGSAPLAGGSIETEEARAAWAQEFIAACKANNLLAVAITDHHDICLSKYVMDAAAEAGNELLVFPGVEITCSDNAQCLVIFDPQISAEVQKGLLTLAGNIAVADHNAAQTCMVEPARETIAELVKSVAKEATLKDYTVILPHFSKQDAHKSLNEQGHHPRFAALPIDGVYIERPYNDLGSGLIDQSQKITLAAMQMADMNVWAHRS